MLSKNQSFPMVGTGSMQIFCPFERAEMSIYVAQQTGIGFDIISITEVPNGSVGNLIHFAQWSGEDLTISRTFFHPPFPLAPDTYTYHPYVKVHAGANDTLRPYYIAPGLVTVNFTSSVPNNITDITIYLIKV